MKRLDRLDDFKPCGEAIGITLIQQGVGALGCTENSFVAVVLHQQIGHTPDVDFVHAENGNTPIDMPSRVLTRRIFFYKVE